VGETSLLTRAALVVSGSAGDILIAHEGALENIWWNGNRVVLGKTVILKVLIASSGTNYSTDKSFIH
jgi:hypothetical protein